MRRIAQIEARLGVELFERRQSGYVPTPNGVSVADTAERIEREVRDLQSVMTASQRALTNAVRFTSSELLVNFVITPCLLSFQKLKPDIRIELISDDRLLDLAHGEADVALRGGCGGSRPEGAGIVMRRMPSAAWAVYCSRGYANEQGIPASREEIRNHATIGMEGPLSEIPWSALDQRGCFRCPDALSQQQSREPRLESPRWAGRGDVALHCWRQRTRSRALLSAAARA